MTNVKFLFISILLLSFCHTNAQNNEEYYKKASELYKKGEYQQAIKQIDLALKNDPNNAKYLLLKGESQTDLKQFQPAFDTYTQLIIAHPDNPGGWNHRGLLLDTYQQFESAIEDFNQALELNNPDSIKLSLYLNRGVSKVNLRNFQGAYDDFMSAFKIDSLNIGVLNNLAMVSREVGKGDQTLGYLYKILSIDSTFIGAYGNIGYRYQEMGDYKTAIQFFDKVLSLQPNEPLALNNRGYNKYKLGDYAGALADINKSISIYEANSFAFKNRALVYIAMNKKTNACDDLNRALQLGFATMYGDEVDDLKTENCK